MTVFLNNGLVLHDRGVSLVKKHKELNSSFIPYTSVFPILNFPADKALLTNTKLALRDEKSSY